MGFDPRLPAYLQAAVDENRELLGAAQETVIGDLIHAVTGPDRELWQSALDGPFGHLSAAQFEWNGQKTVNSLLNGQLRFFLQGEGTFTLQDLEAGARAWAPAPRWTPEAMVTALREAHGRRSPHRDPAGAVEALTEGVQVLVEADMVHRLTELGVAVARHSVTTDSVQSNDDLRAQVHRASRELDALERRYRSGQGQRADAGTPAVENVVEEVDESQRVAGVGPVRGDLQSSLRTLLGSAMAEPRVAEAVGEAIPKGTSLLAAGDSRPLPELVSLEAVRRLVHDGRPVIPVSVAARQQGIADNVRGLSIRDLNDLARRADPAASAVDQTASAVVDAAVAVRAEYWARRGVALGHDIAGLATAPGGIVERIGAIRGLLTTMTDRLSAEGRPTGATAPRELRAAFAALGKGAGSAGPVGQARSTPSVTRAVPAADAGRSRG